MNFNSRLFDRIRIGPSETEEAAIPVGTPCDHPGCRRAGEFRAPKGRGREGQFFLFCIEHVKAYNATYNYFQGMNFAVPGSQRSAGGPDLLVRRRLAERQQFRQHQFGGIDAVGKRQRLQVGHTEAAALGDHFFELAEADPRAQRLLDIGWTVQRRIAERRRALQQTRALLSQ